MNKDTELKVLESLKKDSYFSQAFSADTIELMKANVKSDFYILTNVPMWTESDVDEMKAIAEKAHDNTRHLMYEVSQKMQAEIEEQKRTIEELQTRLEFVALDIITGNTAIPFEHNLVGIVKTIRMKMAEGIALSELEKNYIADHLT